MEELAELLEVFGRDMLWLVFSLFLGTLGCILLIKILLVEPVLPKDIGIIINNYFVILIA